MAVSGAGTSTKSYALFTGGARPTTTRSRRVPGPWLNERGQTTARTYTGPNLPVIAASFMATRANSFTSVKIARGAGNPGESRAFPRPDSRALWAPSRRHRHVDFTLQHCDGDIDWPGRRGHDFGE